MNGFVIDTDRGVPPHLLHDSYVLVDSIDNPYDPDIQAGFKYGRLYEVMKKMGQLRGQARALPNGLKVQPPTLTAAVWQSVEEGRSSDAALAVSVEVLPIIHSEVPRRSGLFTASLTTFKPGLGSLCHFQL